MKMNSAVAAVALSICQFAELGAIAHAQQNAWPSARTAHHMAWHSELKQVVMFGGAADSTENSSLWGWDGTRWQVLAQGGPAQRGQFALAYDAGRDRLVVHGGGELRGAAAPLRMDDTWEWDRRTWRRVSSSGPGARDHHALVYDAARKQIVLFGGADSTGTMLNDTWGWNGQAWKKLASAGPAPRSTHRLAYDSGRRVVVLFGGFGTDGLLNDTWEWDGASWKQITTSSAPAPRFAARIAYDPVRQRTVLFGGRTGNSNIGDTWEYDGRSWTRIDAAGPALRNVHEMAYDQRARAVLMFGGLNAPSRFDDLWAYNGAWRQLPRPDARASASTSITAGPHAVGYRVIDYRDNSRSTVPARDFEGNPVAGQRGVPLQISVWYPAQAGGAPMRVGEYWALATRSSTLGGISPAEITATSAAIRSNAMFPLGVEPTQATADSIRDLTTSAVRDAAPVAGRFPLIVATFGAKAFRLAEHLASHGYVVAAAVTTGTAAQQVTRAALALETHTRNMEVVQAVAGELPFVDPQRNALIGLNFDGMAALTSQMRNMNALAVISIDGYETKTSSAVALRASPFFQPARLRVPYLSFAQDNPPTAALQFSDSLARQLKYAARYAYVVKDMEHATLLEDLMIYPQLRAEQRLGYAFVFDRIRAFLDAYVRNDSSAHAAITRSAVQNGFPAWLVKTEISIPALPAIPTAEEVEQIAMSGNVERLRTIYQQARQADPSVRMFTMGDLNLYAFRFSQRGARDTALGFHELAVEAFPTSALAANNLGNAYRDAGRMDRAVELWQKALTLVEGDSEIGPGEKAQSRNVIQQKIQQARGLRGQP